MGFSDMITLRTALPALVAALALAGCASTTPPVTRGAIEPATGTYQARLTAAAGIDGIPTATRAAEGSELQAFAAAGTMVTGMLSPVGNLDAAGAGALGAIGFLAAPPPPEATRDIAIAAVDPSLSPAQAEALIQQRGLKKFAPGLEAAGYQAVPNPGKPLQVIHIKPGCAKTSGGTYRQDCSVEYRVDAQQGGKLDGRAVYKVWWAAFGAPATRYTGSPIVSGPEASRAFLDANSDILSLYVAPRRIDKQWTGAFLYHDGKMLPL